MTYAWHDLGDGRQVYRRVVEPARARSHFPAPFVNSDTMEPTQHMADGKFYSSKAQFRAVTKAHGCVEVGNDPARLRKPAKRRSSRQEIRDALKKAAARAAGERSKT